MALETSFNSIADLNAAWPDGSEKKSDGDNHLRGVKEALKKSLLGFEGAIMCSGTDGGVVNAYALIPSTALPAYSPRMVALFTPVITNTGAATLDVSGLGPKPLVAVDGSALKAGDLPAGRMTAAVYDGTAFRLLAVTKNYIDQIVVSGTLPGVNVPANAGKYFTTDGATGQWATIDLTRTPGEATKNKGDSGTAAQIVNYTEGEGQTITATGVFNLSASGFPASRIAGVLLRIINGGAFPGMTSSGIVWIKSDGTKTSTFSASGIALQTSGETLIALFSYGDGTIYGKAA